MTRMAWLVVACLLLALPSSACEEADDTRATLQEDAIDSVLRIAVSGRKDSLQRLRAAREQTSDDSVRDYIDAILGRWDESKSTYITPRPIQTERECLHLTPEDRYTVRTATNIAFTVEVDENGRVVSIELFEGTKDPELARRMKESIARQRFVPAHDESGLKRAKLILVCRVEVR